MRKTRWWRCVRLYRECVERLALFGVSGGREADEAGNGPLAGVGLGRRVEKRFAFVEEVVRGAEVIAGFESTAEIPDTCLASGRVRMWRERNFGPMANSSGPGCCYEDVGCVRAMKGFGVVFCVKRKMLVLRKACRNVGVQVTTQGYDAYPFGSFGGRAFAEVDQVRANFTISSLQTIDDLLRKCILTEGEVGRQRDLNIAVEKRSDGLLIVRGKIDGIWKQVAGDQSEGKGVLGMQFGYLFEN